MVNHGVDGLLYRPGDIETLSQLLRGLAADPMLRRKLGDAARVRAQDFTATRVAPQVMSVYERVLGTGANFVLDT